MFGQSGDEGEQFDLITGLPVEGWAKDMQARRKAKKMKLHFDSEWLRKRAEVDGDLPCEAGAPEEMIATETLDEVARGLIASAAQIGELVEALELARTIVASDAAACKAFAGPDEISEPERVLKVIDRALKAKASQP